jgi:hypothetical protein
MFGINTKPFAFVCVLLLCFTAYLVPNKDVSGTQNTVKEITGLQKMVEKIKALPDSTFLNGVDARAYFVNEIMEIKKMCEDGKFGPALKAYNHEVLSKFDGYNNDDLITDATARSDLLLLTEEVYNEINTAVGTLSTYPQIVSFAVNVSSAQPYNDSQRVVSWSVNWGNCPDGESTLYWASTWNRSAPSPWPNSQTFGYAGSYSYTITNLPTGNFTYIKVLAFDYEYGSVASKSSRIVNTEVYDKRIALIICGWGRNQFTGTGAPLWSFWNDANLTYTMLKQKGFLDSDIYLLYYNGTHLGRNNLGGTIIDNACTPQTIQNTLSTINNRIAGYPNSLIFISITTHGNITADNNTRAIKILNTSLPEDTIYDASSPRIWSTEFAGSNYIGRITNSYKRMVILVGSCFSVDFLYKLKYNYETSKIIVITATDAIGNPSDVTHSRGQAWYTPDANYSTFFYYFISGLRGNGSVVTNSTNNYPVTSDVGTDKDNIVSLTEAWNWSYWLIADNDYGINNDSIGREFGDLRQCPTINDWQYYGSCNQPDLPLPGPGTQPDYAAGALSLGVSLGVHSYPINLLRTDT